MTMRRYPYLARYIAPSPYENVILWMTEPKSGVVVYIPPNLVDPGPPSEEESVVDVQLFEHMAPATWELVEYTGSVVLRNSAGPALGS